MAEKDYYRILGVPRTESGEGIRDAYRRLARKHHPDRAGDGRTARFQEIGEAYEVLSDPEKRCRYDERRRTDELPAAGRRPMDAPWSRPEPLVPETWRGPAPEPLVPGPSAAPGAADDHLMLLELFARRWGRGF